MTFRVWTPPSLNTDLSALTDAERRIGVRRAVWKLQALQSGLRAGNVDLVLTGKAEAEMLSELGWNHDEVREFFLCLYPGRYDGSQWCYPPGTKTKELDCDVYIMGFNRFKGSENQAKEPWTYFKFFVDDPGSRVIVLSAHPERY